MRLNSELEMDTLHAPEIEIANDIKAEIEAGLKIGTVIGVVFDTDKIRIE